MATTLIIVGLIIPLYFLFGGGKFECTNCNKWISKSDATKSKYIGREITKARKDGEQDRRTAAGVGITDHEIKCKHCGETDTYDSRMARFSGGWFATAHTRALIKKDPEIAKNIKKTRDAQKEIDKALKKHGLM